MLGLIGAGSGLGVSGLIPAGEGWVALGTEGGHTSFSPRDEREMASCEFAWSSIRTVSFERLLSGPGIELIHRALADRAGVAGEGLSAPEITRRALDGERSALRRGHSKSSAPCSARRPPNLALTQGAFGGIYIGGGIVPRLGEYFDRSRFRRRFEDKGRFSDYMQGIPTYVMTAEDATFIGASAILAAQLGGRSRPRLRPSSTRCARAEQPVAGRAARRRPRARCIRARRSTIRLRELARDAEVSQPTVIRFCRSLGCKGSSDFKLRLASGLTGTMPVTHTQVTGEDTSLEVGDKVLGNTASAILQVRDHLNRETIDQAVRLISEAERVEFYAVGTLRSVADDAQFKLLRMGVSSAS